MKRRKFLGLLTGAGLTAAASCSGLYYTVGIEPFAYEVVHQRIALPHLGPGLEGLRAVQISDLHMGGYISREQLKRALAMALDQEPQLVFITGDLLTLYGDYDRALADLEDALPMLTKQAAVVAVMGNHDHPYEHPVPLAPLLVRLGIQVLNNQVRPYRRDGDTLYIAGLDSFIGGHPRLNQLVQSTPEDAPVILLAHEPDSADLTAPTGKFALQISGHSHGGQVNLPFVGRPVLPLMGQKYPAGLYQVGNMLQYTNRGLGMFHLPVRFNCPPEITVFTFVRKEG